MLPSKKRKENKRAYHTNVSYFKSPTVRLPDFPIPKELLSIITRNLKEYSGITEEGLQFIKVLQEIQNADDLEINEKNYLQILKLMLYVEEIQNNLDIRMYDQNNKKLIRISEESEYFKVFIDGLMEDRPSVRPRDIVKVCDAETNTEFELMIYDVMNDHLIIVGSSRFCIAYSSNKRYNIRFEYPNYPIHCDHFALTLVHLFQLTQYFFPSRTPTYYQDFNDQIWFNKNIEENPEQKQAVINIACKSSFPAPYILYGPPGTGKTATLVEAICQVWRNNPSEHILICTPSNTAADVITKRLLQYIPEHRLLRIYSPSKEASQIDDEILSCSNYVDGEFMMLPKEIIITKSIIISTLCACIRLLFLNLNEKHFSYVFIDEAGQATEPDTMIPFNLLSSTREGRIGRLHGQVVIAGDPKQLGPGVRSKIAERVLGKSMLERLMELEPYTKNEHNRYNPNYITKLLKNYRSHSEIIRVSNELFYENELFCSENEHAKKAENWHYLVKQKFPVIFHAVKGMEQKDFQSPSVYNLDEVKVVLQYVKRLIGTKLKDQVVTQNDIGIATPFHAQKIKIYKTLKEQNFENVKVGTAELFQGQEKDVIIISTVRTVRFYHNNQYHIGFLSNPKRFNVIITRARALLIVIGDPFILQTDLHWCYFLNFCKQNNVCRGVHFTIDKDIVNKVREKRVTKSKKSKVNLSFLNDSNKYLLKIDDGIIKSSGSEIAENGYPGTYASTSASESNNCNLPTGLRSNNLLSDIIVKQMNNMQIEKTASKQNKNKNRNRKKKKKNIVT